MKPMKTDDRDLRARVVERMANMTTEQLEALAKYADSLRAGEP